MVFCTLWMKHFLNYASLIFHPNLKCNHNNNENLLGILVCSNSTQKEDELGFQDRRVRPLPQDSVSCRLSAAKIRLGGFYSKNFTKLFVAAIFLLPPQGPSTQQS